MLPLCLTERVQGEHSVIGAHVLLFRVFAPL